MTRLAEPSAFMTRAKGQTLLKKRRRKPPHLQPAYTSSRLIHLKEHQNLILLDLLCHNCMCHNCLICGKKKSIALQEESNNLTCFLCGKKKAIAILEEWIKTEPLSIIEEMRHIKCCPYHRRIRYSIEHYYSFWRIFNDKHKAWRFSFKPKYLGQQFVFPQHEDEASCMWWWPLTSKRK